jgi:hypothetical protein
MDPGAHVLSDFLYFLIYLDIDDEEKAVEHLSKIPAAEEPEIYVKSAQYVLKVLLSEGRLERSIF